MPVSKKKARTSADAREASPSPADALIAKVRSGTSRAMPPLAALDALRKILEHNDVTSAPTKRVGSQAAIDMLQEHYGWQGSSLSSLNNLCRRAFGRKSWGTP